MAPQDDGLWEHSSRLRKICPSIFQSTENAFARLQQLKLHLAIHGADFMDPCGKKQGRDCNLLKNLNGWNGILAAIKIHIKELFDTRELEVCFPEKSFDYRETADRIQRAMLLLHWLLVKHTCVVTVEVENLGELNNREWFALFCDGIRESGRLKTLRIGAAIDKAHSCLQLLTACSFLRDLQELSLPEICDTENTRNVAILADVISCNENLRVLEVGGLDPASKGSSSIMRALQRCHSLSDLTLGVSFFNAESANIFMEMLNGNNTLKSLCLDVEERQRYITVRTVSSALKNATALVKLELVGFYLPTSDAWMLAVNLVHAQTVQDLYLGDSVPSFSLPTEHVYTQADGPRRRTTAHIEPYIYILQNLLCLRSLELDLLRFPTEDQRVFLEALAANKFLEDVHVMPPHRGCPSELFRIADETGTASRIRSAPVVADEIRFTSIPRGSHLEEVILMVQANPLSNEKPPVNRCFEDLRALDHVSNLSLVITGNIIQLSSAKLLAAYLQNTGCLNVATLNLRAKHDSEKILLNSIARNTSMTILCVENWCLSQWSAEVLADLVCSSKRYHSLTYNRQSRVPEKAFVSRLSASIQTNYTLVSVRTYERKENSKNWAIIQNAATRNAAFLERAARLVSGLSTNIVDAEDLALVASSSLLPLRVSEMAAVSESEAASMIRRTIKKLRDLDAVVGISSIDWDSVVCA